MTSLLHLAILMLFLEIAYHYYLTVIHFVIIAILYWTQILLETFKVRM